MKTKTKNRVTKIENSLWDIYNQLTDITDKLFDMKLRLPKTKYEDTLEKIEEAILHADNCQYTIEKECTEYLLEDAFYNDELQDSPHHKEVKEKLDKYQLRKKEQTLTLK
tara:strand:+ start:366 stop:695 length:330 start_codon:yes stop_codon:yes gene_type:complete